MEFYPKYKVAAMHVSPVHLDSEKTVDKVCSLITEAADNGASLVVFPEAFIAGYPVWSSLYPPSHNHNYFKRLAVNSIRVPGPEVRRIAGVAKRKNVFVSIGINELGSSSVGCIYNTNLLIDQAGKLVNHHRKTTPTFHEKLTWAAGDGAGLEVVSTDLGRIGMLICAENCNGLARHAMMAQGEQVHIASYPHGWFNGAGFVMADAVRIRTEGYCSDGKVFTIVSSMFLSDAEKDVLAEGDKDLRRLMDETPRNSSMIMGPGANLLNPVLRDAEGILYADIDLADSVIPKQFHDPAGYMNRFDIFELSVNRSSNDPVRFPQPTARRPHLSEDMTAEPAETWPRSMAAE